MKSDLHPRRTPSLLPIGSRFPWVWASLALALFQSGCSFVSEGARPPDWLEGQAASVSPDPAHPEFDEKLRRGEALLDVLLSADRLIFPGIDERAVRTSFESLAYEATCALRHASPGAARPPKPEQAAGAFLLTLKRRGFHYGLSPVPKGEPDSKVVSYTILKKEGCCATFSLLCMAYLDRMRIQSWVVCLPDHCFVRVVRDGRSTDIESTDFEEPLRGSSGQGDDDAALAGERGHYGRSLNHRQAVWHYFADRLWAWVSWRSTDEIALHALERARQILGSSCQSIEAQEATRYLAVARNDAEDPFRRDAARARAGARFRRLTQNHPDQEDYRAALSALENLTPPATIVRDDRGAPEPSAASRD